MSLCTTWRWPWLLWFLQFWSLFEQIIPNREQWWKKHSYPLLPTTCLFYLALQLVNMEKNPLIFYIFG